MFVNFVETNKRIFKIFLQSGSYTILVSMYRYQTSWRYFDRDPLNECYQHGWCYQHGAAGPRQVVTLIAGSKQQSLLMAGDDDEMFMTRGLNVMPKTTEQHLIVRTDKSVACVTNNKRLRSTFYTIEANY